MELRHAAALALVGWSFLVPPLHFVGPANDPDRRATVDSTAPLSRWVPMKTFKTHRECDEFSKRLDRNMRESVNTEQGKKDVETLISLYLDKYQCVVSDDPRLKAK